MALHDKLEYFTDVMKTLLGDLVQQYVVKNPKLMLRRYFTFTFYLFGIHVLLLFYPKQPTVHSNTFWISICVTWIKCRWLLLSLFAVSVVPIVHKNITRNDSRNYFIVFILYLFCYIQYIYIIFAYTYCNVCPHKNPVDIYFWSFNFLVYHKAGGSSEIWFNYAEL